MLWLGVIRLCFASGLDPLVRVWLIFSTAWIFWFSWQDSQMPAYDPRHVPADHILWNIAPWVLGPVVYGLYRLVFPKKT